MAARVLKGTQALGIALEVLTAVQQWCVLGCEAVKMQGKPGELFSFCKLGFDHHLLP